MLEDIRSKISYVETDEKAAREEFLHRSEKKSATETAADRKRLGQIKARLTELEKIIPSVYEDKVAGRIPEDICVGLLEKYRKEQSELKKERSALEKKLADNAQNKNDVDEFIKRLKTYMNVPELTREMCMELIEFVTVDECPGRYSKEPREIHIYYKLIDKNVDIPQYRHKSETSEDI